MKKQPDGSFIIKQETMRLKFCIFVMLFLAAGFFFASQGLSQNPKNASPTQPAQKLTLTQVVMCEDIKDYSPYHPAVVFSITIGKVSCFTSFDPVPEKTVVYHKWYHLDKLSTNKRLTLQPPRWATYTSIQLRETDKGPWRVDILDEKGNLLDVVRFSITD